MIREKVEDRKLFHIDDKIEILHKTDFKCAHCGKRLGWSEMTIDHAIPISKAGTNEDINIVPLCEKCNKEKGNLIIPPEYFYFYLLDDYKKALTEKYEEYIGDVDYLSENNFLPIDYYDFSSNSADIILSSKYYTKSPKRVYLIKSQKRDLDGVYEAYLRYFNKNKIRLLDSDKMALKYELGNWYDRGAIYTLKNVSGDIVLILPMRLQYCDLSEHAVVDTKESLVLSIGRVVLMYKKNNYLEGLANFLLYLMGNGISIHEKVFSLFVNISFYDFEKEMVRFIKYVMREACELRCKTIQDGNGSISLLSEGVNIPYKMSIEDSREKVKVLQGRSHLTYKDSEKLSLHYKFTEDIRSDLDNTSKLPFYDDILSLGSVYRG